MDRDINVLSPLLPSTCRASGRSNTIFSIRLMTQFLIRDVNMEEGVVHCRAILSYVLMERRGQPGMMSFKMCLQCSFVESLRLLPSWSCFPPLSVSLSCLWFGVFFSLVSVSWPIYPVFCQSLICSVCLLFGLSLFCLVPLISQCVQYVPMSIMQTKAMDTVSDPVCLSSLFWCLFFWHCLFFKCIVISWVRLKVKVVESDKKVHLLWAWVRVSCYFHTVHILSNMLVLFGGLSFFLFNYSYFIVFFFFGCVFIIEYQCVSY